MLQSYMFFLKKIFADISLLPPPPCPPSSLPTPSILPLSLDAIYRLPTVKDNGLLACIAHVPAVYLF